MEVDNSPGLDFETQDFYTLYFTASDGVHTVTSYVNVTVSDGLDPPIITNLPDATDVEENVTTSAVIFTVAATDQQGDVILYSLTSYPDDGKFSMGGVSGQHFLFK